MKYRDTYRIVISGIVPPPTQRASDRASTFVSRVWDGLRLLGVGGLLLGDGVRLLGVGGRLLGVGGRTLGVGRRRLHRRHRLLLVTQEHDDDGDVVRRPRPAGGLDEDLRGGGASAGARLRDVLAHQLGELLVADHVPQAVARQHHVVLLAGQRVRRLLRLTAHERLEVAVPWTQRRAGIQITGGIRLIWHNSVSSYGTTQPAQLAQLSQLIWHNSVSSSGTTQLPHLAQLSWLIWHNSVSSSGTTQSAHLAQLGQLIWHNSVSSSGTTQSAHLAQLGQLIWHNSFSSSGTTRSAHLAKLIQPQLAQHTHLIRHLPQNSHIHLNCTIQRLYVLQILQ